jgi:hypothetical protein
MLMRNSNTGAFEVYDISHNAITAAAATGAVGMEWTVAGFGDFSSNAGESDMLMRNSNTGAFEYYDISHNAISAAGALAGVTYPVGTLASQWTVAGFGDFSGNPGETDMLMRATSGPDATDFEVYDISHNAVTSVAAMGAVGLEWTVAGFGDFSGNANETDMLMRNSNTGASEVYDISHNAITSAAAMGAVGLEWQVGGFGVDPPAPLSGASIPLLVQAMASFEPGSSTPPSSDTTGVESEPAQANQLLTSTPHPH